MLTEYFIMVDNKEKVFYQSREIRCRPAGLDYFMHLFPALPCRLHSIVLPDYFLIITLAINSNNHRRIAALAVLFQ